MAQETVPVDFGRVDTADGGSGSIHGFCNGFAQPRRGWSQAVSLIAIFLSLFALQSLRAQTPTLVQHVATAIDRFDCGTFNVQLPNPSLSGNCLVMGIQFNSAAESVSSITDDKSNTWTLATSVTNGSFTTTLAIYYVLNCTAATQNIVVHFTTGTTTHVMPQAVISEFNNVATASASDGTSGSNNSRTAGSITTTANGDLVWQYGAALSTTSLTTGGGFNGTSITKGTGFTLLNADLQVGTVAQYQIQSSSGAINPAFTTSGSDTWGTVAIALKAASAGTAPPGSMYIVHKQDILLSSVHVQGRGTRTVMQFPSTGNLLVGSWDDGDATVVLSGVTDGNSNTWSLPPGASRLGGSGTGVAQIFYAVNASTSTDLSGITVSAGSAGNSDEMLVLYDIANAPSNPVDQFSRWFGNQSTNTSLTTGTITPLGAGLIIHDGAWSSHTANGLTSPSGGILDGPWNNLDDDDAGHGGTDPSPLIMDNPKAHFYNSSSALSTFTFTYNTPIGTTAGVGNWGAVSVSFVSSNPSSTAIGTVLVQDDFSGQDDNPITGNWNTTGNAFKLASHTAQPAGTASDREAIWNQWSGGNDQYSQVNVTESGGSTGVGVGVCVRHSTTIGTKTMYRLVLNGSGGYELMKFVSGTGTSLKTGTVTYSAGAPLGLSAQSTTLTIWYNGSQVFSTTDSAISSGWPGLAYSSTATSASVTNWVAGNPSTSSASIFRNRTGTRIR